MRHGCPQESVLGPTLWNLAYNYVLKTLEAKRIIAICYANDTAVILSNNSLASLIAAASENMLGIANFLRKQGCS